MRCPKKQEAPDSYVRRLPVRLIMNRLCGCALFPAARGIGFPNRRILWENLVKISGFWTKSDQSPLWLRPQGPMSQAEIRDNRINAHSISAVRLHGQSRGVHAKSAFIAAARYSTRRSSVTSLPIPPWIPQSHTGPHCCPEQLPVFSASCIRCPAASKPSGEEVRPPRQR